MNDSANKKQPHIQHYADGTASVMRKAVVYTELHTIDSDAMLRGWEAAK